MTGFLSNITWKSGLLLVILVISEIIAETFLKKASKKKTGILMNWSKSLGLGVFILYHCRRTILPILKRVFRIF